jgi:hypothetical protein
MSDNRLKLPNGMELVFAPGCFDGFEGTQEELDELVKEITESFVSGEALTQAQSIDDLSEEELDEILSMMNEEDVPTRTLQ